MAFDDYSCRDFLDQDMIELFSVKIIAGGTHVSAALMQLITITRDPLSAKVNA
jgi:hypothetical protein